MKFLDQEHPVGRKFTGFIVLLGILLVSLFAVKAADIGEVYYRIFASSSVGAFAIYCGVNVVKAKVEKNGGSQ